MLYQLSYTRACPETNVYPRAPESRHFAPAATRKLFRSASLTAGSPPDT
jgi:hypothetical protein